MEVLKSGETLAGAKRFISGTSKLMIKSFLTKIKLIQHHTCELKTDKTRFVKNLKNNFDEEEINFSTSVLERFSQAYSKYKGSVGFKNFKLKKRNRLFDIGKNLAVVSGTYKQSGKSLLVPVEINGFQGGMILYYIILSLFYIVYLWTILRNIYTGDTGDPRSTILIIMLQMIFFYGVPYLIMRRSIRYLKSEITKDFSALSK